MKSTQIATIFYYAVILLIGLPVWYWTTTPIRHALPDVSMLMVHSQRILNQVKISVITCDSLDNEDFLSENTYGKAELRQSLQNQLGSYVTQSGTTAYRLDWRVRSPLDEELPLLKQSYEQGLQWLDQKLDQLENHKLRGNVWIYLIEESTFEKMIDSRLAFHSIIFGNSRFVYIRVKERLNDKLEDQLRSILERLFNPTFGSSLFDSVNEPTDVEKRPTEQNVLLHRKMNLDLNLIIESAAESELFYASTRYAQMQTLIEIALLKNSGIYSLVDIDVSSQFVHYALGSDFQERNVRQSIDNQTIGKSKRFIHLDQVPTILSKIESRLSPPTSEHTINFNILIPSWDYAPLFFFDPQFNRSSSSILTGSKGHSLIWNEENDFNHAFKAFVRSFLGLSARQQENSLRLDIFFAKWELDLVMRRVALEQLAKTLSSLESIEKLLNKGSNIVIEKRVSQRMHLAVDQSHQAIDNLENNHLDLGFKLSSEAFANSESAFFDPSLLSLLYFPEDQKYAIYFPLFLPILLQLGAELSHLYRNYFKIWFTKSVQTWKSER